MAHHLRLKYLEWLDSSRSKAGEGNTAREGAGSEVEELLKDSVGAVYRYCMRLSQDADQALDLTQETMLKAWRSRETLADPRTVRAWLLKIASNCWNDHLRSKPRQPYQLCDMPVDTDSLRGEHLEREEAVAEALAALDALPTRQRQVMYLVTVEQLPQEEVADILEISPQAVKASLSAARKQLRAQLSSIYQQYCKTDANRVTKQA